MSGRLDVPVAGGSLAAFALGDGAGARAERVVVAVHGITANSQAWLAVARELGSDVGLVAPDIRGRGESHALPGPYGMATHAQDVVAVLDHLGLEQATLVGHSLGAYIVARVAFEHPERVRAVVLVDGGLTQPMPADIDPQAVLSAALGPALARLQLTFPSLDAYVDWWQRHPAFEGSDIGEPDLAAYAAQDLVGEPPALRSGVSAEAVRADAQGLFEMGEPAERLSVTATLLCVPRGLLNDPNPLQPIELVRSWAAQAPEQRTYTLVSDLNHYSLVMGARGAAAVASAVRDAV